ncbi:MAG TPA: hypothetical protein VJ912_03750 [Candidatus Nanoarchaeia archaeon]|nr:hypothetical protein [Candidatus Nanoarchaeia archaeon]
MWQYLKDIMKYSLIISLLFTPIKEPDKSKIGPLTLKNKSKKLFVNLDDGSYYKTQKSEKQGIEDLVKESKKQDYEEAWIYLPKNKTWYEIGKESEKEETDSLTKYRVKRNENLLKEIIKKQKPDSIIFYHIHPYFKYSKLPSNKDIETMIQTTLEKENKYIKHKIVSGDTITEYSLTKKGINYFKNKKTKILEKTNENFQRDINGNMKYNPSFLDIKIKNTKELK